MQPGKHDLLVIPRGASRESALLRVTVAARRLGARCADIYFQDANVTGAWAETQRPGGFQFHAADKTRESEDSHLRLGRVHVKIVRGNTTDGVRYINIYVNHLHNLGLPIGGLLGEDDHSVEETPTEDCGHRAALGVVGIASAHASGARAGWTLAEANLL